MSIFADLPNDILKDIYKTAMKIKHTENLEKGGTLKMRKAVYARTAEDIMTGKYGIDKNDVITCALECLDAFYGGYTQRVVHPTHEAREYHRNGRDYTVVVCEGPYHLSITVSDSLGEFCSDYYTFRKSGDKVCQLQYTRGWTGADITDKLIPLGFMKTPNYKGMWNSLRDATGVVQTKIVPASHRHIIYQSIM